MKAFIGTVGARVLRILKTPSGTVAILDRKVHEKALAAASRAIQSVRKV